MSQDGWWQGLEDLETPLPTTAPPAHGTDGPEASKGDTSPFSRRGFLHLMGFSLAATACQRTPVREAIPLVMADETLTPGNALHYATTCGGCEARCGLVVKTRDGRPIKVEGNALSPASGGATCAVGQATVLSLYDATRLKGPLWRGEHADWDEIDGMIRDRLRAIEQVGGKIAVLSGAVPSPPLANSIAAWCQDHSNARHVSYQPISTAAIRHAHAACYDRPVVPRYRFAQARAVVGLEADFLATWLSPVSFARGYVEGRRQASAGHGDAPWHAQFESRLSPTGCRADLRVPVEASQIGAIAHALLDRLMDQAGLKGSLSRPLQPLPAASQPVAAEVLDRTAATLWRHRGAALVVAGVNDPAVQILVAALNELLDGVGQTVDLSFAPPVPAAAESDLPALLEEMERGDLHALIVHGVNPVYDTPFGARFAQALEGVALTVSLADRRDETAARVDFVCPDHHPLEAWDEAETEAGASSLAQPVLAPLFATRSAIASLGHWSSAPTTAYDRLRTRWREQVFASQAEEQAGNQSEDQAFEAFWNHAVHDGVASVPIAPGSLEHTPKAAFTWEPVAAATAEVARASETSMAAHRAGAFDLCLFEGVSVRDGRHANNPWLQELPDPVSRTSWGNHAAIAPKLAEHLGVDDGDIVRIATTDDRGEDHSIELPILRQPGQAPETIAVALGYGRQQAGPVGDGVGTSAYPLVGLEYGFFRYARSGVSLSATGRHQVIVRVQKHDRLEGRPIIQDASWADAEPELEGGYESEGGHEPADAHGAESALPSLWPERKPERHQWGMAIDLDSCVGCAACVIACQAENNVPVVGPEESALGRQMHWIRIDRYYRGTAEQPDVAFQPMMCQHCANAPCETVCPVLATVHSSDGLNQQIYNRCIGTRYCANNCPYKVRRFNWFTYARNERFDYNQNSDLGTLVLNPDVTVRSRGVMEKCSMCVQRVQEAKLEVDLAARPLADGDIKTACQQACPTDAIVFGDRLDSASQLTQKAHDRRHFYVLEELGTRPAVGYLGRRRHPTGEEV
jgi:molybdopterin-containing oxidoreductase family iron-sulfur binding subunit